MKTRRRRSRADLASLLGAVQEILGPEEGSITIRHLFYRLVSAGAIQKTEAEYKALCHFLTKWRRSRDIAWEAFADSTRWMYGAKTFDSLSAALENTAENYRKNLWSDQSAFVEIWCEKDAIASILLREADAFGVKVFPCRGFASLSSLNVAASHFRRAQEAGKEVFVYYFGDHDPSGVAVEPAARRSLSEDFGVEVQMERVAVTREQIASLNLPTRPTKKSDTRARNFEGESVEVDAIPPVELRRLAEECITRHIEPRAWEKLRRAEELERRDLERFTEAWPKRKKRA